MEEESLNSVSLYLKEINKTPVPTDEENKELLRKYKSGDQEAYKQLISRNLRLVIPYAKYHVQKHGGDFLDAIQNGNLGLAKAIEKFDMLFDVKFSTYAVLWIKQSIRRKHIDTEQEIRIPNHIVEKNYKIDNFIKNYEAKYGIEPTDEKIIEALKISEHYLKQYRNSIQYKSLSLDAPMNGEEENAGYDFVKSNVNHYESFEKDVDKKLLLHKLKKALTTQEYYIIYFRYFSDDKISLDDLAMALYCRRQNVDQIEKKALDKIKKVLKMESSQKASVQEVLKESLIPFPFSKYVFLYLLKNALTDEEYYIYYHKEVLYSPREKLSFFSSSEIEALYLKAKKKEREFSLLDPKERFELAIKDATRNKIFEVEPTYIEKNYEEVLNYFSSMTYLEFMNQYQDQIGPLTYHKISLLKKFFCHDKEETTDLLKKEAQKELNLKEMRYQQNIFLPKEVLYDTYVHKKHFFSKKEQEIIETKLFNLKGQGRNSNLIDYRYIEKLEKIYFNIYEPPGIYFTKEEVKDILKKKKHHFTIEEIQLLEKEYGIDTYPHQRGELEKEFGLSQAQLTGKIRNLRERILKLKYEIVDEKAVDKEIYLPFLRNDLYGIKKENRLLTIQYLEGKNYAELSFEMGIPQNKICNTIQDVIRNIDFYRFGIINRLDVETNSMKEVLKDKKYSKEEKEIIGRYYEKREEITKIAFELSLSINTIQALINRFQKDYEKHLLDRILIEDKDYIEEITCHITDSILDERERSVLAYKYGIKCEDNKEGIFLKLEEIIEKFSITEHTYYHICQNAKKKIKKRKAGLLVPLLGHMNRDKLEVIVNDEHVPLTLQERELLNRLKGMNGYSSTSIDELMFDYHLTRMSVLRKYQRAILSIYKYQNGEKNGQISYIYDILPNLKYFSLFEVRIIQLFYEQHQKMETIERELGLTKDSLIHELEEIRKKLTCLLENNPNISKFNFEYARTVLDEKDLPLYVRTDMAKTCYKLYTGESGNKKYTLPDIINALNMNVGTTSLERIIDQVKLAVCKYQIGYRKEISFTKEEIALFYQEYSEQLSKEEKIKIERCLKNDSKRMLQYRNYWLDNVHYIILEKTGKLPFDLDNLSVLEIESLLKRKNIAISKKTKDVLLSLIGKSERDMMSGKEKMKVFKILKPLYILSLEKQKTYQKTPFYLQS